MKNDMTYKVLWVDDDLTIVNGTMQDADEYGIILDHYTNWQEAEVALKNGFDEYSAIILDAFCQIHPNEGTKEEFITSILPSLTGLFGEKKKYIPWYILSAGTMANFPFVVKSAAQQHLTTEWGNMLYIKERPNDDPQNSCFLFQNIQKVAKRKSNNIVLFRHKDVFAYFGKDKLIDEQAKKSMLSMLGALYFPEKNTNYVYEGNPLRKVMEYVFRAANKVGLLPKECFERDDQINLLESNRYMSGMNTKHSLLRYGKAGTESDGRGGDTIFPEYLGHITKAIIEFGSVDSHTNEAYPYTIDDADLTLTENEKELFFSYVLQLCHVIKFFGKFVEQHPDISINKSMKKAVGSISAKVSDYDGKVFPIERDENGNCHCGDCILNWGDAKEYVGKQVRLSNIKPNQKENTKIQYPIRALKFDLV